MFRPVTTKVDFPAMEENVLSFWQEGNIFAKSIESRPADNEYVFYDGPPFATGLPHFGHLVPGTIKDAIPRYQTMKGKRVNRRFGWDCHGLPVEYEMERTLGISGPSAIEEYGIANFNEQCRSIVLRYTGEWKNTINRMGRWVDFDHGYRTMDTDYMESIWWVFKTLFEKGLIYQGYNILPYSPALGCPLSNFEVNLGGYQDVVDQAVTVRFAVEGMKDTFFLAWTTTPWTLPSNLALAFGPDIDYVKVLDKSDNCYYILGKARLSHYYKDETLFEIVEEQKGSFYKGMRYKPLFPYFENLAKEGAFVCVTGDYVTTEDGCGIVHTASGFGVDDYQVLKGTGIPVVCPIDDECRFTSEVPDFQGRFVKDTDKDIIAWLKEHGLLVKRENYLHSYPFCYRTHKPLIYRAMSCWFVDVQKIKGAMLAANEQITWMPEHLKEGRFGKWLENAHEWAISRNRFWGNPIPIWKCDGSDYIEVIGSRADLEAKCGVSVPDLHKHFVDELTWPSPDGKGTMRRISDVLDCWFESGSMPYAQLHYPFENKEFFEEHFPADFICEGLDQTRGWFYTLTVIAAGLWEKPAFTHCVTNGIVLTAEGKKMSKSAKNYTDPMEIVNQYGADSLRFALMNSAVVRAEDLKFSEESVKDVLKTLIIPLWNAYSFFVTYANIDGYEPSETAYEKLSNPMDKWIISSCERFVLEVTEAFDAYDIQRASSLFVPFLDDLNNWYIRRSRRRFWRSENDGDKKEAYDTLYRVLMTFIKVAAPLIPFTTEEIYQNLKSEGMEESIHLCSFPTYEGGQRDFALEKQMALTQKAIAMGRAVRATNNLKIRQPLQTLYLVDRENDEREVLSSMEDIIAEELNVKKVHLQSDETGLVSYNAKANFKVLGSSLGKHMKEVASQIAELDGPTIGLLLDGKSLQVTYSAGTIEITSEQIIVQRTEMEGVKVLNDGSLTVGFDTKVTEELLEEGIARDIVRSVQNLRKESGFDVSDRIELVYNGDAVIEKVFANYGSTIANETLANSISKAELSGEGIDCGEHSVQLSVKKA
ncbi:isoleucyl-tRNA synthetase [Sphaerochaeta pleomorpha str. Grapes]|uniref:Isoleucine--tRNA ligase n=1 Tax=Sphaerochaeta pleomorpha (strain ATCC BAA-1885 / DSM 22778 / Grapes) TaxID=158190 RepID=G8QWP9_SPHPG|nr:isoleucine--tRNA ligase [Sphaerochaeta pleomorpha]AEV28343.1 isoleucyl-tRNA synthetase [Sphaerochaeta pleomorpha str. Grapes]